MTSIQIKENAPQIYSADYQIRSYHVDSYRRLSIQQLCNFFQDIAGLHTDACGVGWEPMQKENLFWVLSRLKLKISNYPEWKDKITIKTWSNGLDGLMGIRHFQVISENGEEMIAGISSWLMLNTKTRRLIRPDAYLEYFPQHDLRLFKNNPEKLPALKEAVKYDASKVVFTETDMNQHMNNVSYIDRIINSYDIEFLNSHEITDFEINFLKETRLGEILYACTENLKENEFLNSIVNEETEKETVRAIIRWQGF